MNDRAPRIPDFRPVPTGDGSFTLRSEALNEQYHSRHGAAQESRHVFIEAGLKTIGKPAISILEVGLGTGLNALLTWIEAEIPGLVVDYCALEPFPIDREAIEALDHTRRLGVEEKRAGYLRIMRSRGEIVRLDDHFSFRYLPDDVRALEAESSFDLIYFDAFAPAVQPELWTEEVFTRLYRAMIPAGSLVTYCAKGEVRRTMQRAGFRVERLPGPPGKREMLRAMRPSP
jgi:tRNA U34 5-methylaminomethyl-2-thiouridine-forming methyltransferase MnmC